MQLEVVATRDDTPHPIANVGEVSVSHVGQKGKLMNVLHVPKITKNLVSVRHIVDQGMEVRFTHLGSFIEEEGRVIAQGRKDGRMFILDSIDGGTAMFAKGQKAELDIDLLLGMNKAVNAEEITQQSVLKKNLRMRDAKLYTHREREREAQRMSIFIKGATVTNDNQPLQKVTKSLYIVTDLGQLPFILFT